MKSTIEEHRFNSDLLLTPGRGKKPSDLEAARDKYGPIYHVLDHKTLRQLFLTYDGPANKAKTRARKSGIQAIFLILIALVVAAIEPLADEIFHLPEAGKIIFTVTSVGCGIVGFALASMGALFADKKCEWLYQRLMTERIRQFYFQTFVFRLPEILQSLRNETSFKKDRDGPDGWFEKFKLRFAGPVKLEFERTLTNHTEAFIWLHDSGKERINIPEHSELASLEPLFAAYRELRIIHQISYANYKLKNDDFSKPGRQAEFLWRASVICMGVVCAIHIGVLFGVGFHQIDSLLFRILNLIIVLIAIAVLAARAVEQGLQPEREVERYQRYLIDVQSILTRFDAASRNEKPHIMKEMEWLSFNETQDFLICGERAQFIM